MPLVFVTVHLSICRFTHTYPTYIYGPVWDSISWAAIHGEKTRIGRMESVKVKSWLKTCSCRGEVGDFVHG